MPDEADDEKKIQPPLPDSLLDSWFLQHFPGRFLDEISESMDLFRFLRSLQARGIENIEALRKGKIGANGKDVVLTDEQAEQIRQHDAVMKRLLPDFV